MIVWKIDNQGFYVEPDTKNEEELTEFDITIPPYTVNEDGSISMLLTKQKWNGIEWVEGWTQEEIDEWKAQQNQPSITYTAMMTDTLLEV